MTIAHCFIQYRQLSSCRHYCELQNGQNDGWWWDRNHSILLSLFSGVVGTHCDYMYVLFELVCYHGYWYILYVTLLYCCYLIQDKATPVWVAALNGHVGALNVLIRAKADVNAADEVSLIYFYGSNNKFYWATRIVSIICYMYMYLYPRLLNLRFCTNI